MICTLKNAWRQLEGIACIQMLYTVHVHQQKQVSSLVLKQVIIAMGIIHYIIMHAVEDKFCVTVSDGTERCISKNKKLIILLILSL